VGGDPSHLSRTDKAIPGALCPTLGSPELEKYGAIGENSVKGYKDD